MISETFFKDIADEITVSQGDRPGVINVNTAPLAVLMCLPGVDQNLARSLINYRSSNGSFANLGELLDVPGWDKDKLKAVCPKATVRSQTFRILCEGKVTSSGATRRILAVVRVSQYGVDTVAFREDL